MVKGSYKDKDMRLDLQDCKVPRQRHSRQPETLPRGLQQNRSTAPQKFCIATEPPVLAAWHAGKEISNAYTPGKTKKKKEVAVEQ